MIKTHIESKANERVLTRHLIVVAALICSFWMVFLFYKYNGIGAAIGALIGLTIAFKFGPTPMFGVAACAMAVQFGVVVPFFAYAVVKLILQFDSKISENSRSRFCKRSIPNEI